MKRPGKIDPLRLAVNILSVILFLVLVTLYLTDNLGPNPIQKAQHLSGDIAIVLLLLSLSITPLRTLTGFNRIGPLRKTFGLNAFYYAALHLLIFLGLDYQFNLGYILEAIGFRKYILVGMAAFLILLVMAVTSIKKFKIMAGKAWKKIHSFVYLAGILVVLHYGWTMKGNFLTATGAVGWPVIAGIVLAILLILRIKPVKNWVVQLREKAG